MRKSTSQTPGRNSSSSTKRVKNVSRSRVSSSDSSSSDDSDLYRWIGKPFQSERSEKAYKKVSLNNATYTVGDSVYVEVEGHKDFQPLLLKELWEDENGEMWAYGTWYYVTWELGKGKPRGSLTNEFFESDRGDELPALSIRSRIPVVTDLAALPDEDDNAVTTFICRNVFDPITRSVHPRPCLENTPASKKRQNSSINRSNPRATTTQKAPTIKSDLVTKGAEGNGDGGHLESPKDNDYDSLPDLYDQSEGDVYEKARRKLQLSSVPDVMPCRESERGKIQTFLQSAITRGGSQLALYISGMPGTGKTATLYEVVRNLRELNRKGKLPKFKFVEVNGLKLPNPEETYSVLAKLILNDNTKLSAAKTCQALGQHFATHDSKREVCVLLIDEIDQLVTKKQQLLYNIFDWPQSPNARLVVVGIANTMDLPERLLPRIQSRLGDGRIMFAPYNRTQIEQIVKQRLQGIELFDSNAIDFSARKVAGLSGDVRRALQLCRRAVEVCKRNGQSKVTIEHVNSAVKEIDSKLHCQVLASLNPLEKLFLICAYKHSKAVPNDEPTYFQDVVRRLKNSAPLLPELGGVINHESATRVLFLRLMDKLVRLGLLRGDHDIGAKSMGPSLALSFDYDDMRIALGSDHFLERIM